MYYLRQCCRPAPAGQSALLLHRCSCCELPMTFIRCLVAWLMRVSCCWHACLRAAFHCTTLGSSLGHCWFWVVVMYKAYSALTVLRGVPAASAGASLSKLVPLRSGKAL